MTSPQDFRTLYEMGSYAAALKSLKALEAQRPLEVSEHVILAELLSERSEYDSALAHALQLTKQRGLSPKERCRVRYTLGVCYFRKGNASKGTEEYRVGIELAEHSNEQLEECRLRVQLFRDQVRWLGPHPDASLSTLRRRIHQVADPATTMMFQLGLAELAAHLALLPRARKHLETARALLPRVTNVASRIDFRFCEVALLTEEADFGEALHLGLELAGDPEAPAGSNLPTVLAHILIVQARFDDAERWLHRALSEITPGGGNDLLLRETKFLLRVRQGTLDEAASIDASVCRLLDDSGTHDSLYGLRYLTTRVMWLYRTGQSQEGLAVATNAIPRIERVADRVLLARMKLLVAEGLGLTGEPQRGAAVIAEVFETNPDPPLEITAEAIRVAGNLVAAENPGAAFAQLERAADIHRGLGDIAAAAEIEREVQESTTRLDHRPPAAPLSERIAALVEMGGQPRLLGSQVLDLIIDTDSVVQATLVERRPDGRHEVVEEYSAPNIATLDKRGDVVGIALGARHSRHYEIRARPKATATARGTLLALSRLIHTAGALANARQDQREQAALWPEQTPEQQLGLICTSERMLDLVKTIRRVAVANVTVLLAGETGVGKELFARALHQASPRSEQVFLPFNCATVPRDMFESQLFGHRRGSFTGAIDDSTGVIRSAAGGTLFLDEIGEMSLDTQPKLLRFLESGEIRPLGDPRPQLVDVRIVAATNANLDQLVAEGRFREDLFYRLNVIRINIPPLRERREEIPALVDHFLERYGRELQKSQLRVADETLEYLVLYRWPGNVRQLANEIRRLVALAEPGAVLMPAHLSEEIAASRKTMPAERPALHSTEVVARLDQPLTATVEHVERAAIQHAVAVAEGNLIEAAKMLGLSRKGLYLKRQRLGLE